MTDAPRPHLRLPREQQRRFRRRPIPVEPQPLPAREPAEHSATLLSQLDDVLSAAAAQRDTIGAAAALDLAVAFKPDPVQLAKGTSAAVDAGDHTAVVYFPEATARTLRTKLAQYADPALASKKTQAPRNNSLVAPIEEIRSPTLADLADPWDLDSVLESGVTGLWLELWTPGGRLGGQRHRDAILTAVDAFAEQYGISSDVQRFEAAEHDISLTHLRVDGIRQIPARLPAVTRIREPSQARLEQTAREMAGAAVADGRIAPPRPDAPKVGVLDTGIAEDHPLLTGVLAAPGVSVVPGVLSAQDAHPEGHGTGMAGAVTYRDLALQIISGGAVEPTSRIANVRLWSQQNDHPLWASRTEEAVIAAETMPGPTAAHLLALSSGSRPDTPRTSWSFAVDRLAYENGGRLICIAAGNVTPESDPAAYPATNQAAELHDPAQAMNALTVGGYTDLDALRTDRGGLTPVARAGELSPHTTTGTSGPIKPDVVMEAGNACPDGTLPNVGVEELGVLTTSSRHATGRLLESYDGTSIAAAAAAGFAGELAATHPSLRPETVRALIVNSARWPAALISQLSDRGERIRCAGYGVPDRDHALASAANRATLIHEGAMAPYSDAGKLDALHLFRLPLPDNELLTLGAAEIVLSITLSYFVEPHETRMTRYAGAMLQWDVQRRSETEADFLARINHHDRDPLAPPDTVGDWQWDIGPQARRRGSVQSDRVSVEAAALAGDRLVAVFPAGGWWSDHLKARKGRKMPYALVATIDAAGTSVDIYSTIAARIPVQVDVDAS